MNKKVLIFVLCLIGFWDNLYAQEMGDVKTVFETKCSQCHGSSKALNKTKSLDEWKITVKRMSEKANSNISGQEAENIAEYLSSLKK